MISDEEYERILREGISLFNRHRFFEAHDKWEEAWQQVKHEKKREPAKDPRRDFLQGLILLAVAYLHWRRRNRIGALRKFEEALARLNQYPDSFSGIRLGPLRAEALTDSERLGGGESAHYVGRRVPRIHQAA